METKTNNLGEVEKISPFMKLSAKSVNVYTTFSSDDLKIEKVGLNTRPFYNYKHTMMELPYDHKLDSPVLLTSVFCTVGGDRTGITESFDGKPPLIDAFIH